MKLVSYRQDGRNLLGLYINQKIYNVAEAGKLVGKMGAATMKELLDGEEKLMNEAREIEAKIKAGSVEMSSFLWSELNVIAPVPEPASCRDGYAFRQHVAAARRNRKLDMITQFRVRAKFGVCLIISVNSILN
jgi:fumarylacetoacetate (FAA) hydrolase